MKKLSFNRANHPPLQSETYFLSQDIFKNKQEKWSMKSDPPTQPKEFAIKQQKKYPIEGFKDGPRILTMSLFFFSLHMNWMSQYFHGDNTGSLLWPVWKYVEDMSLNNHILWEQNLVLWIVEGCSWSVPIMVIQGNTLWKQNGTGFLWTSAQGLLRDALVICSHCGASSAAAHPPVPIRSHSKTSAAKQFSNGHLLSGSLDSTPPLSSHHSFPGDLQLCGQRCWSKKSAMLSLVWHLSFLPQVEWLKNANRNPKKFRRELCPAL